MFLNLYFITDILNLQAMKTHILLQTILIEMVSRSRKTQKDAERFRVSTLFLTGETTPDVL